MAEKEVLSEKEREAIANSSMLDDPEWDDAALERKIAEFKSKNGREPNLSEWLRLRSESRI